MSIMPSPRLPKEFAITPSDERSRRLLESFGPRYYGGVAHLTPARARKLKLLYDFGFSAGHPSKRACYLRGSARRAMSLETAILFTEAMS